MPNKHPLDQLPVTVDQTLGTLATKTLLSTGLATNTQNYKATSIKVGVSLTPLTDGDGPVLFGLANAEISGSEVEEYLESVPTSSRDTPAKDQVARAVQVLETLGQELQTRWVEERILLPTFREGIGFRFWVYNAGIAFTTGSFFRAQGRLFGRWLS